MHEQCRSAAETSCRPGVLGVISILTSSDKHGATRVYGCRCQKKLQPCAMGLSGDRILLTLIPDDPAAGAATVHAFSASYELLFTPIGNQPASFHGE